MQLTVNELAKRYPSASEYITQIYLIIRDYSYCNNRRLSEHIGVSPSAVSQAVNRLKRLNLTDQDRYGMIVLLDEGNRLAEEILKRHYLLEHLMVKTLGFPWELADQEAENLQDKVSAEFITYLYQNLGSPQVCPHGNPFPGNPRADEIIQAPRMSDMKSDDLIEIVRITEEGERIPGLLHACYEHGVMPGSTYKVRQVDEEFIVLDHPSGYGMFQMPLTFSEHIRVRKEDFPQTAS
jgi:DtxR family Mn-dependent transcriptional regulator